MYIFTTLEFPTHNIDFHLLTASVNAKYYCQTLSDNGDSSDIDKTRVLVRNYLLNIRIFVGSF